MTDKEIIKIQNLAKFVAKKRGCYHLADDFAQTRFTLREAWNTTRYSGQDGLGNKRIITPFRAVNNAGDVLSRKNYS